MACSIASLQIRTVSRYRTRLSCMDSTLLVSLTGFAFISALTPGPNNLLLMSSGALFGWQRSLPHLGGVLLGFAILMSSAVFGLGSVVAKWPWLVTVVRIFGAAWLAWMSFRYFLASLRGPATDADSSPAPISRPLLLSGSSTTRRAGSVILPGTTSPAASRCWTTELAGRVRVSPYGMLAREYIFLIPALRYAPGINIPAALLAEFVHSATASKDWRNRQRGEHDEESNRSDS